MLSLNILLLANIGRLASSTFGVARALSTVGILFYNTVKIKFTKHAVANFKFRKINLYLFPILLNLYLFPMLLNLYLFPILLNLYLFPILLNHYLFPMLLNLYLFPIAMTLLMESSINIWMFIIAQTKHYSRNKKFGWH